MSVTNISNQNENEFKTVEEFSTDVNSKLNSQVILYNDEEHVFEDVIVQIMIACKHTLEKAEQLTFEVHNNGKAKVYESTFEECIKASSKLEEIDLRTQIIC